MSNINDIAANVAEYLPDVYNVSVYEGTKNNGVRRQGIIINNNTVFSPIIYVDELIEQGFDAEDIAIKVLERYK